jgi:hypothetical protein
MINTGSESGMINTGSESGTSIPEVKSSMINTGVKAA